jgi:hypothetical protein
MTESVQDIQPLGLVGRMVGVVISPTETFKQIIANPRPAGVLLIVALVVGISAALPQFTENGQQAVIKMQSDAAAQRGAPLSDQTREGMQKFAPYFGYFTIASMLIFMPVMSLFFSGLFWALFNVVLGGTAAFKQVLAIITHAHVITAVGFLLAVPFLFQDPANYAGPFTLSALAPGVDATSRLARFLKIVSVFLLWWSVVASIGLSILYRRKLGGILIAVLGVTLGLAYLRAAFGG